MTECTENPRVSWLVTTMGYGDQLLYWEPILATLTVRLPGLLINLTADKNISSQAGLNTRESIRLKRVVLPAPNKASYQRVITFIHPAIVYEVWRQDPDVIVVSEFGLLTLYGMLSAALRPTCKLMLLVESDPGPMPWWRRQIRKLMARRADVIMTNNDAGADYLTRELGVPASRIRKELYLVSQPGASDPEQQEGAPTATPPAHRYFQGDHVKFLYVGQIAPRKGLDTLIEAIAAVPPLQRASMQLAIVGEGTTEEKERLARRVAACSLQDQIHFMGRQPYSKLAAFYENSDVFVFPTLNDYRALVGFEAISHGLPVLMSKHDGAASEVVDEQRNGLIFDPLDREDFSSKLAWFLENRDKLKQMAEHSRHKSAMFTPQAAASNLANAIVACHTGGDDDGAAVEPGGGS